MDIGNKIEMLRLQREEMDAGIKYNQSLPPNERVMFNADLLRHITQMIPTPLKVAVAHGKKVRKANYIYRKNGLFLQEEVEKGQSISFIQTIEIIITALENNNFYGLGNILPIFDDVECILDPEIYDISEIKSDAFDYLLKFFESLKIDTIFNIAGDIRPLDQSKQIFQDRVNVKAQKAISDLNKNKDEESEDFEESDLVCAIPYLEIVDELDEKRRVEALRRLQEAYKLLTPKAKGKGK